MSEFVYSVTIDGICLAKSMNIEGASLFARALFEKNWKDQDLSITISRESDPVNTVQEKDYSKIF